MAQLTSLEELCRLYPNLQVDNLDSVQYMVPDDKIIQYTDAQGQQVLAAIDSSNIQFGQTPASAQQGVFVIEAVDTQALETNKPTTGYKQPRLVVQQISSAAQPAHQIVGTQQSFILQQLDHGSTESYFYKDITDGENKSPCILQMDQNKPQNINPQSQYVIHPIQANLVQVDSSKQQQNSLQTHCFSHQPEVNNTLQACNPKNIDMNEMEQSSARQLDCKNLEYQTFVGQVDSLNCQQQCVMQQIEPSVQKSVVELGKQDRHFVMQQLDGTKQSGFILQQLPSNNPLPNQILMNQLKGNKNQQTVIQNLEFTEKEAQTIKFQNLENTHFIMQNLDGSQQQQVHYQTQHFLVPQGEKLQPKVIVQRVGIPKTVASTPQLVVQQLRPPIPDQATQFVVQQFDVNKQQNLLPYFVSAPSKHSTSTEIGKDLDQAEEDTQSSHCAERGYIFSEKEEENVETQIARPEGDSDVTDSENNKQDPKQGNTCLEFESQPHSEQSCEDSLQSRINQQIQTLEANERQIERQQQECDSQRRFIQQQIGVNQNQIQASSQQSPPQTRFYGKVRIAENQQSSNAASLPPCPKTPPNQTESESHPSSLYIIPKGDNPFYPGQYQSELRFQGTPLLSQAAKDVGVESNTSQLNDTSSHKCGVMHQNVELQQESSTLFTSVADDSQKPSNMAGLSQQKNPITSCIKQVSSEQTVTKAGEIMITSRVREQPNTNRIVASIMTSEQHSECPVTECDRRKLIVQSCEQNLPSQAPTAQNLNQINIKIGKGGGKGSRAGFNMPCMRGLSQCSSIPRGVQTNTIRPIQNETVCIGRKPRDSKGTLNTGTGGSQAASRPMIYQLTNFNCGTCDNDTSNSTVSTTASISTTTTTTTTTTTATAAVSSTAAATNITTTTNNNNNNNINNNNNNNSSHNNNNTITGRTITASTITGTTDIDATTVAGAVVVPDATSTTNPSSISNSNTIHAIINQSNDSTDGPRMLVLLPNGERKLVRFPITQQNMHINQLWQQVRFSLGSQIPIIATEQTIEKNTSGQLIIKGVAPENQESKTSFDTSNSSHLVTSTSNLHTSTTLSGITSITTQQQRPRNVLSRLVTSPAGNNTVRSRTQCTTLRGSSPRAPNPRIMSPPQHHQTQNVLTQTNSFSTTGTQIQPLKEAPKLIAGQVAICPFCGISSLDFNKCIRCRRKLPANVKSQSIFTVKKKRPEKANASNGESSQGTQNNPDSKNTEVSGNENKEKGSPLSDRKKAKALPKKKKIADEPTEILILSSDDEEENQQNKGDAARDLPILSKEPVYGTVHFTADEIAAATKGNNLMDDLMENIQPESYTTLQCRSVRIGSYKAQPKDRILMSSKGVRFVIPALKSENATIIIPTVEILKILIHFGKQMPVVFIYASPKIGFRIRSQLGMEHKSGPYYDPSAVQDETHKRITLILEKMTDDNKTALHNMFVQSKLLEELSEKEANEILIRASPLDEQGLISVKPTDVVRKIMIYPPPPEKGGIALNNQDYACLGEDQFLNDVIIDFYLKYLLLKVLSPEDRERTHVFSTFFYKRLTTKPKTIRKNDPENDPKLSPAEKRHMRVKGWTKQVNLFEKDFIIVPINEHSHWFLAIICFPGLTGPVKFSDNSPVEPEDIQSKKGTRTVQIGNTTITHIVKTERNSVSMEMDQGSDRDEAEGDQDDLHPSSDEEECEQSEEDPAKNSTQIEIPLLDSSNQSSQGQSKEPKVKSIKRKTFKEPIKQPCILIFDSLAGASRVRVVATLRDYLKIEYKKKMGQDREFSKDTIKGAVPKVPQQNNFTDCGLYVLQYVESFFQDPLHDFKLPLKYLQDWFPEEVVSCKRQELASIIRSLMEEQGIKVDEISLPVLTFTNGSNTGEEQAKLDEEDEEEEEEDEDEDEEGEEEDEEDEDGNEDEEELERTVVAISEFENEDEEEDMDMGDEEDQEEDDLDEEEDEIYEELDLNEIRKRNVRLNSPCSSEMDTEGCPLSSKKIRLPAYEGSDEEHFSNEKRVIINDPGKLLFSDTYYEISDMKDHENPIKSPHGKKSDDIQLPEQRKNVPLTEFQDFESQISCTTIEKNMDNMSCESGVIASEVEEDEILIDKGKIKRVIVAEGFEHKTIDYNKEDKKEKKPAEVTNVINKLVNVKGITVCRMEDGTGVKQVENKRVKVDCDTKSDENNENSESNSVKVNSSSVKRSFEALKSVRIPKKAERAVFLTKRQRIDET